MRLRILTASRCEDFEGFVTLKEEQSVLVLLLLEGRFTSNVPI
jgi:hypothetical protein